jgi:phage-related protein
VVLKFSGVMIKTLVKSIIFVISAIQKVNGWIDGMNNAFDSAVRAVVNFATGLVKNISRGIAVVQSIRGKVISAVSGFGSMLVNAGQSLIQGLIDGIMSKLGPLIDAMSTVAKAIKDHMPGSPVKRGPLTAWNNTGPTGPGGRLVGLLADGLSNTRPVTSAMDRLSAGIAVRGPGVMAAAAAGGGGGRGAAVVNIYDVDGVLMGTMDGRIEAREDLLGQTARAM